MLNTEYSEYLSIFRKRCISDHWIVDCAGWLRVICAEISLWLLSSSNFTLVDSYLKCFSFLILPPKIKKMVNDLELIS